MSDVIFEITKEHLETGLRGYPVGYCTTSKVDPQLGLFYIGKPIPELAYREPKEVLYMLYHGHEGDRKQIGDFFQDLCKRAHLSSELVEAITSLPRKMHPMHLLASALLMTSSFEAKEDYKEDCLNIIAKAPLIAACVINHHAGWEGTSSSHPEKGYMENFAHLLRVPHADPEALVPVFKLFNILHYDHGGGNLSTFVGKAVASGLENMYGSLASALLALKGPRHGKANQDCLEFTQSLLDQLGDKASVEEVASLLRSKLAKGDLIYGFGHAVLRVEDPRATVQYEMAERLYPHHPLVKMALLLREAGTMVLKENPKITNPYPNVDAVSGALLSAAGFPYPQYYTVLFGMSRIVGIAMQIVYERLQARGGKGVPIYRPKYFFKGF